MQGWVDAGSPTVIRPKASLADELNSEGVVSGAAQTTPSGQLVVLLKDYPTTGGYPVIGVLGPDTRFGWRSLGRVGIPLLLLRKGRRAPPSFLSARETGVPRSIRRIYALLSQYCSCTMTPKTPVQEQRLFSFGTVAPTIGHHDGHRVCVTYFHRACPEARRPQDSLIDGISTAPYRLHAGPVPGNGDLGTCRRRVEPETYYYLIATAAQLGEYRLRFE